jgi:hypothetical protein
MVKKIEKNCRMIKLKKSVLKKHDKNLDIRKTQFLQEKEDKEHFQNK